MKTKFAKYILGSIVIMTLFGSCTTEYIEVGEAFVKLDYAGYSTYTETDFWGNRFNYHDLDFGVENTGGRTAYDIQVTFTIHTRRNSIINQTVYIDHLHSGEGYSSFIPIQLTNDIIDHYHTDITWAD